VKGKLRCATRHSAESVRFAGFSGPVLESGSGRSAWVVRDTGFEEVFSDITPTSLTQTLYVGAPGNTKHVMTIEAMRPRGVPPPY